MQLHFRLLDFFQVSGCILFRNKVPLKMIWSRQLRVDNLIMWSNIICTSDRLVRNLTGKDKTLTRSSVELNSEQRLIRLPQIIV